MKNAVLEIPPLLPGRIVHLPGRGEMFIRHHQHADTSVPTVLLLVAMDALVVLLSVILFPYLWKD